MEFNGFEHAMAVIGWLCAVVMVWALLKQNKVFGEKIRLWTRDLGEAKRELREAENKQMRISAELQRMEDRAAAAEKSEELLFRYLSELGRKAREPEPPPEELIRVMEKGLVQIVLLTYHEEITAKEEITAAQDAKKCIRKYRKDLSTGFIDSVVMILPAVVARKENGKLREDWMEILQMLRREYAERLKAVIEADGSADGPESEESAGGETECGE